MKFKHAFRKCVSNGLDKDSVVYISGPMSGHQNANRDLFSAIKEAIIPMCERVISPAEIDHSWSWEQAMAKDLDDIKNGGVTHLILLPGWNLSDGAKQEVHLALSLGLKIVMAEHLFHFQTDCADESHKLFCDHCDKINCTVSAI